MFCFETMFAWFQQSSSKVNRGSCNSSINWLQNAQGEKKKNVLAGNWEIDTFALFLWRSAKSWKIDLRSFNLTPFQTRSIVQFSDVSIFFCFLFHRIYPNFAMVKSQCIFKIVLTSKLRNIPYTSVAEILARYLHNCCVGASVEGDVVHLGLID